MRTPGGPRQHLHKVISVALAHNRMIHLECRFRASSLLDGYDAPDQSESRLTWRKEEPVALMLAALDIVSIFYAAARLRLSLLWGNQRISFDKACSRIYKRKMRWCVGFLFDMLLPPETYSGKKTDSYACSDTRPLPCYCVHQHPLAGQSHHLCWHDHLAAMSYNLKAMGCLLVCTCMHICCVRFAEDLGPLALL